MSDLLRVNAHTHLELTRLAHLCPRPERPATFTSWLSAIGPAMRRESPETMREGVDEGIAELRAAGVDVVGDISYTGTSIDAVARSGLAGVVFCEVQGFGRRGRQRLEMVKGWTARRRGRAGRARLGLSIHSPYSSAPALIREAVAWARRRALPVAIHLAESRDEVELIGEHRGPLRERMGYPVDPVSLGRTPVGWLAELDGLAPEWLVVHGVHVTPDDAVRLADAGCIVVHCPRSNANLGVGRMPLELYVERGVRVVLGTDSRASAPSLSVADELAFATRAHPPLSPAQTEGALTTWSGA